MTTTIIKSSTILWLNSRKYKKKTLKLVSRKNNNNGIQNNWVKCTNIEIREDNENQQKIYLYEMKTNKNVIIQQDEFCNTI